MLSNKNSANRIRWSVVALAFVGVLREFLAPHVKFHLPEFVENNAAILFILLGIVGVILLFFDNLTQPRETASHTPTSVTKDGTISLHLLLSFFLKLIIGFALTSVSCALYVAVKSAAFEWSSSLEEIALIWIIIFAGWMFAPTKIV
ncbi:MAG: hypothetical protein ABJQ71_01220 [Roseibium sp.]